MELVVNGERTAWPSGTTIQQVVERAGAARSAYAVEVNKRLVPRREHAQHVLAEGDEIEIVVLVGGG
ncbi:MAG: sulfur carrier protein ThiS [Phycisphaerales bacterium]|nr:sulfur carrier protein ThiS [Phycisphaerales bacterium]